MKENYIELGTVSKFTCAVSDPLIFSLIEIVGSILSLVLANTNEIGWSIYSSQRCKNKKLEKIKNDILLPKLFWPTVRNNCSSDQEKLLKFEAESREFAEFLRSLEQFIQSVKGQNNYFC